MTLVNAETGEVVETTYGQARESVRMAREAGASFFEQIVWQIERQAWTVLGYSSWDEMREAEYADMGVTIPRADRPEVVSRLRKSGLTQVQIADTLGVSHQTVGRDLNVQTDIDLPDVIETPRGPRPTSYTKTPAPAVTGEGSVGAGQIPQDEESATSEDSTPLDVEPAGLAPGPRPADHVDLSNFINADPNVQLTSWRKHFMAAIAKSGDLMLFTPEDVATKAGVDLINELERLSADLENYVSRVRAKRPQRLTAIRGGAQ